MRKIQGGYPRQFSQVESPEFIGNTPCAVLDKGAIPGKIIVISENWLEGEDRHRGGLGIMGMENN